MESTAIDFDTDVLAASADRPVLVDFWAPWCGPCKMLKPLLEQLATEAGGKWSLVKINTDLHADLAARHGIRGIPDVRLYHRGREIARFTGFQPEPALRAWLRDNLPTPKRESMARARELLHAGRAAEAAALLRPLADANPDDEELLVLTARALAFTAPAEAYALVAELPPSSAWNDDAQLVRTLLAVFGTLDRSVGHLEPSPWRDRYLAALAALRAQDFRRAADGLVALLLEKPRYDGGQARTAALALFRHLGPRHPVSEEFSRPFGMAMNA